MIDDSERREAARRLRELDEEENYKVIDFIWAIIATCNEHISVPAYLADLIEPSCDRDELLEEVKELEKCAGYFGLDFDEDEQLRDRLKEASEAFAGSARRIREACGVQYGQQ